MRASLVVGMGVHESARQLAIHLWPPRACARRPARVRAVPRSSGLCNLYQGIGPKLPWSRQAGLTRWVAEEGSLRREGFHGEGGLMDMGHGGMDMDEGGEPTSYLTTWLQRGVWQHWGP